MAEPAAQGGMKSEAGRAAYWRMQFESCQGALADLIVEHRQLVEAIEDLIREYDERSADTEAEAGGYPWGAAAADLRKVLDR